MPARKGGPGKVVEVFTAGSEDPIADLRQEGEPVARDVREQLDAVSPGLGNPVMSVSVSVAVPVSSSPASNASAPKDVCFPPKKQFKIGPSQFVGVQPISNSVIIIVTPG